MKKWYTITFSAKMSEDDVRAMKKYFYDTMEESMEIGPCSNLNIKLDDDQKENPSAKEEDKITVLKYMRMNNKDCYDITDATFSLYEVALDVFLDLDDGNNAYDIFNYWLAEHLEIVHVNETKYGNILTCQMAELVDEYYSEFQIFCEESNADRYKMNREDRDDNIEIALLTIHSLLVGNYSDSDYELLNNLIKNHKSKEEK